MRYFPFVFFGAFVLCAVACNFYWYRAKAVLKARGLPVSYLHDHWRDVSRLRDLIAAEGDPSERARLVRLRRSILGFFFAGLGLLATFMLWSLALSALRRSTSDLSAPPNPALERTPTGVHPGSDSDTHTRQ